MYLLAIDLGTTSVKAALFNESTEIIASAHERANTKIDAGGISSQEADEWLSITIRNCAVLKNKQPEAFSEVGAIAVTGHMMGCLPVDKNGHPLSEHMLHSDTRARSEVSQIEKIVGSDSIYQLTGNILAGTSVLAKMMWLKRNRPEVYRDTYWFLNSKDYITGFLTGQYNISDYSDASHAGIIDIHQRLYPKQLYNALGLDIGKMPELKAGTDMIGELSKKAAELLGLKSGIPVMAGAGDGACSAIGAGAGLPGDTYCCMGTTAWIAAISDRPVLDHLQRSYNIITADAQAVGSYGTIQNCGRSTDFAQKFFSVEKMQEFDQLAAKAPAGSDDLIFLPYIDGERAPIFNPDTQGVFFGLSSRHSREHGLRAVLEGVAYAIKHNADVHRENGLNVDKVSLIGGGGRSEIWRLILASVIPADIVRVDVPSEDATTLGAAIVAGTGIGLFSSIQDGMSRIKEIEKTAPIPEWKSKYTELFTIYKDLYPSLSKSFAKLSGCAK